MKPLDEMQQALMRTQFRRMYYDLGLGQSCVVLQEILETAAVLAEVIAEELHNEKDHR